VDSPKLVPEIQIYNTSSELIKTLEGNYTQMLGYSFRWDGTDQTGDKVKPGVYVVLCTVGDKRTVRKIIFVNK
jgi:flagellar hook assembly protein FlgD